MAEDSVPPNPSTPPPPTSEPKDLFVDAKLAGSPYSESCTLILTEGYPAKNFAMSGDKYGVFPLKGKLLNVRDASPQQLLENAEIQNVIKILGLQVGKSYENVKEFRYGHLMIMANQGHDSLHIIGLLINFLHYFWPSLLKVKNFMSVVITPILKAYAKKTNEVSLFYTMPEYKKWHEKLGNKVAQYKLQNFQGPETIESEERAEYLDQHIKDFVWINDHDGEEIEIAFSKKIEVRKEWLRTHKTDTYFDSKEKRIRYLDFISIDFKQYLVADLRRSIPSMVDGLKPCQRKILFYALKMPNIHEIDGAQFSDFVFKYFPYYHHGEESLDGTIIGMAQNYVGSNNINLLQPNGQFGTRLMGGKDHDASGTCLIPPLSPITRYLFPKDDDELILEYLHDDGQSIEPACIYPIIPMVLVNGCEGRGIVCSSFIPNYNPRDIISNLKRLLNDEAMEPMLPWYNGFKGEIEKTETPSKDTLYTTKGMVKEDKNAITITITELPIGTWTHDYKEFLEAASWGGKDIKAYTARHGNTNNVHFEITMTEDQMNSVKEGGGFLNKFKLTTTLSTANMHLFDANDQLKKYDTPEQILEDFFHVRLGLYEERRSARIRELEIALLLLENKAKFIGKVCDGEIRVIPSKKKDERCAELKDKGLLSLPSIARLAHRVGREVTKEEELGTGYDYLLSTPVVSFTYEKIKELEQERDAKNNEFHELTNTSSKSLWLKDLDALIRQLDDEKYPLAEKREPAK